MTFYNINEFIKNKDKKFEFRLTRSKICCICSKEIEGDYYILERNLNYICCNCVNKIVKRYKRRKIK